MHKSGPTCSPGGARKARILRPGIRIQTSARQATPKAKSEHYVYSKGMSKERQKHQTYVRKIVTKWHVIKKTTYNYLLKTDTLNN